MTIYVSTLTRLMWYWFPYVHNGHFSFKYRFFENSRLVPEYSFSLERYRCDKTNLPTTKKSMGCQPFDILRTKFMQSLNNWVTFFFKYFIFQYCWLLMQYFYTKLAQYNAYLFSTVVTDVVVLSQREWEAAMLGTHPCVSSGFMD